ncbi:MDIS1-interacting receptor like kinase 2-like [Lactuca sativa]|uniref:MDIS1-interacting receptor like kinase 2-like n=1 Tax=Lactuca sativa TaxID=4236 RepID=UPI0022AE9A63|nr:MDIS1-interacting receptor like kinase 2-like [Lactuca sativa]
MADLINNVMWQSKENDTNLDEGTSNTRGSGVADDFTQLLEEVETKLYPGCTFSSLEFLAKLMHIKLSNVYVGKSEAKQKNIKIERALLPNKGKPITMDYDTDMTYDPVGEPKDMFSREVEKTMWQMIPFHKWTWKKVSPAIKDTVIQHLGTKFDMDQMYQDVEANMLTESFQATLLKGYRDRQADATEYFMEVGGCHDIPRTLANPANGMDVDNWKKPVEYFQTYEHKIASEMNKKNLNRVETFRKAHTDRDGVFVIVEVEQQYINSSIPSSLANLSNLQYLYLLAKKLSRSIPSSLGDLRSLNVLHLSDNQLSGHIPIEIGNLKSLTDLQSLTKLAVSDNQLSGSIPSLLANWSNLHNLFLRHNKLPGLIPQGLGSLYLNKVSGPISIELRNLKSLTDLLLSQNQLSRSIPSSLGDLRSLNVLHLSDNQLSGHIPIEIGNLKSLTDLQVSYNQLSGSIPSSLENLSNL